MSLLFRLRRRLAELFLRGRLLEFWVNRKVHRLEQRYQRELVQRSTSPAGLALPRLKLRTQPRRILFISDFQWEHKELVPELQAICPVDALNLNPHLNSGTARQSSPPETVVRALREYLTAPHAEPDVILFYARPALLSDDVFELLRKTYSCPVLGLNLDDKVQFLDYRIFSDRNDNYQHWARHFDLNLTNVRAAADWYSDAGLPVYYMAEGYHPKTPTLDVQPNYEHEIAFVGSWRAERAQIYNQLRSVGVPIKVFGWGWPNGQEGGNPEKIYRSSMMSLGIGFASPSQRLTTLKTR